MRYRVIVEPRAERDLEAAAVWILDQSEAAAVALRWAKGIRARIATLRDKPLRCPVAADSDAYGEKVRVLLHGTRRGQYRVLFAVRGGVVHVLTVRHSSRHRTGESYARMAADADREAEAREWADGFADDPGDEAR